MFRCLINTVTIILLLNFWLALQRIINSFTYYICLPLQTTYIPFHEKNYQCGYCHNAG